MSEADRALAALDMRLESELQRRRIVGAGSKGERIVFSHRRIEGVDCFGAPAGAGFGTRVLGFGLFAPSGQRLLDRIRRHYADAGQACHVIVANGAADRGAAPLLKRNGFKEEWVGAGHALVVGDRAETLQRRWARMLTQPGVDVGIARTDELALWERLARTGFGQRGRWTIYSRVTARALRAHSRSMGAFIGWADGKPAASAALLLREQAGLLFSGSVLARHRGRGLQPALIAARLAHGLGRDAAVFFSQSSIDGPSAHNLHDAGFRRRWTFGFWSRD